MRPVTIPEWSEYINTLSGSALRSKAMAANTLSFIRGLEAEGIPPRDVMQILRLFAQRFVDTGQEAPSRYDGALVDLGQLLAPINVPDPTDIEAGVVTASDVAKRWRGI